MLKLKLITYDISHSSKVGLIQEIELDPDVALDLLDVLDDDVENMDAEQVKITDLQTNRGFYSNNFYKTLSAI